MPLLKLCAYSGCRSTVPVGQKYCSRHACAGEKLDQQRKAMADRRRGTSAQRGYTSKWRKARLLFLMDHPFCVECQKRGILKAATDVDHIIPHKGDQELFWDESNWQPLCHECHSRKTASEDGGFGHVHTV